MKYKFDIPIDESKLQKTIAVSKSAFLAGEAERTVSHAEFLYQQSRYIKKQARAVENDDQLEHQRRTPDNPDKAPHKSL